MDSFKEFPTTPVSPAHDAAAVTPDDAAALAEVSRALYVGQAGDLAVTMAGGQQVTFAGVAAGSLLPVRAERVRATGTTAGAIVALW
ncbi:spike base protein, RCAP_Rcc01079 family [Solirhodobacter olei]|uniref:spike base protein, RCAP_Rcc01079 family n=1 Tax=Solirhodobacter olei TaxID=2493082 RepID=UPI000FD9F386|nr:hypothetical protein [Solirhodobacter olei]